MIKIYASPAGQAKLSEPDVKRILSEYLGYVTRAYDSTRLFGLESAPTARAAPVQNLSDIFIPLTLRRFKAPARRELEDAVYGKTGVEAILAHHRLCRSGERAGDEVLLSDLLSVSERLAIVGGAGSGKSTVLAYLASTLARAAQTGERLPYSLPGGTALIPLVVPLRYYRDYQQCCSGALGKRLDDPRAGTVRYRGGLFEEKAEFFQFIHLTFQEFLAARLLAKKREANRAALRPHIGDSWWREVFLLVYGYLQMDYPPAAADYLKWLAYLEGNPAEKLGGAELAGAAVLEIERPNAELRRELAGRLAALLADKHLECPVALRAGAGRTLARLGDPRPGVGIKDGIPEIEWVKIEAGPFIMGSTDEQASYDDEKPQFTCHLIRTAYGISRYPVTVAQYQSFVEAEGYGERDYWTKAGWDWREKENCTGPQTFGNPFELPNHPQVGVSWYEAAAFCNWLSGRIGYRVSLPSEAQWERSARHVDGRIYPWGNQEETGKRCNMADTGIGTTSAAGVFPMGNVECGAADMAGNVWEWCSTKWRDGYSDYEEEAEDGLEGTERRVLRGGAFYIDANFVRCATRLRYVPDDGVRSIGFRVVASPSGSVL